MKRLKEYCGWTLAIAVALVVFVVMFGMSWEAYFERFPHAAWWTFFVK